MSLEFKCNKEFVNNYIILARFYRIPFVLMILYVTSFQLSSQVKEVELTIEIVQKGSGRPAAWVEIQTENNDNIGGWYGKIGPKGFPMHSPITIKVPVGTVNVTAWNSIFDPVNYKIIITGDKAVKCRIKMKPRFDFHKFGYTSFDFHNHMDGDKKKNCPPYIYPYCGVLGIDHLGVCQMWFCEERASVSYDSIIHYLEKSSTPELNLKFGAETPKLRYGHSWFVNHPGLVDPLGDYLNWHDVDYWESLVDSMNIQKGWIDLRNDYHPKWHPPFVDRLLNKEKGAFAVAAHPTRWWHQRPDEVYPATNIAADLAFDLLCAQSYNGIVVLGDNKDNIFYQNLWFNTLNLGYRLVPVAETDGNVDKGNMGFDMLTYTWTGVNNRTLDTKSLTESLKKGHTMLSAKAVMFLTVDGKFPPGSVFTADGKNHTISVKVYSEPKADEYISYLVLYRNGKAVEKLDFRAQKKRKVKHDFVVNDTETAWYVVKSFGKIYPENDIQFDVMTYARECQKNPDNSYTKNTGVSMTAPVFFNSPGWRPPQILISNIHCKVLDKTGKALKNSLIEVWNIREKLIELKTNEKGEFDIKAPATIDIRFTLPDGQKEQQWLFYEYPPLLDLIENTYTISWSKDYPNLKSGQMPWEAFRYKEIKEVLTKVNWTIRPSGKIMLF